MVLGNIYDMNTYKSDTQAYQMISELKSFLEGEKQASNGIQFFEFNGNTITEEEAVLENHCKNIDVHYVVDGSEKIYIAQNANDFIRISEYSSEEDSELFYFGGELNYDVLKPGDFAIIYPGEKHATKISNNRTCEKLKKIIMKVNVNAVRCDVNL